MTNVIVIGAGIIGSACAWRLAQTGARVTLLERSAPAAGASQAALGVLQFHAKPGTHPAYQHLSLRSRELYPAMLAELAHVTGERVPYDAGGQLSLAFADDDWPNLEALLAANAELGLPVERATDAECRLLEPALNPALLGGIFFPEDAWVDNTALTLALAQAAQRAGAVLERAEVTAVEQSGGRAVAVHAGGKRYRADWVVLAAGCWSSQIAGVSPLPVRPVRGQALAVAGRPVRRVVSSPRGYLVPKAGEQTLVGATVEEVGYDESTTIGGLAEVAAAGLEIAPRLAGCTFLGAWAGLRPATPDGRPCLGPFAACPNLIAAAGHFRNGILQAPATAEIVCALVAADPLPAVLSGPALLSGLAPDRSPAPA
jgi:glycine oxidase